MLPNQTTLNFQRVDFIPEKGFKQQNGETVIDETVTPDNRQFFWFGRSGDAEVSLTVKDGLGGGLITTPAKSYSIQGGFANTLIRAVDRDNANPTFCLSKPSATATAFAPHLNNRQTTVHDQSLSKVIDTNFKRSSTYEIKILVLYSEQAEIDANRLVSTSTATIGGQRAIEWIVNNGMNQLNQTARNSGVGNVRFTLAALRKAPAGFRVEGDPNDRSISATKYYGSLQSLKENLIIQRMRDDVGADLVVTMIRNGNTASDLPACGVAVTQVINCSTRIDGTNNCGLYEKYDDYAYSMVSVDCATLDDRHTFAHEIGHMLGMQHQNWPGYAYPSYQLADPYSYAHQNLSSPRFNTVMWSSVDEPHYLNFSNPNVNINTVPSGSFYHNNVGSLKKTIPFIEVFRGQSYESLHPKLLKDSFESP